MFLLYYLPSVLIGILPDRFTLHALMLCKAIKVMVDVVSIGDIEIAEQLLLLFW